MFSSKNQLRNALKILTNCTFFTLILTIFYQKAEAQQMFVDDATVTSYRSFQIETWYGTEESWLLTAISPGPGFELGAGIGIDSRDGFDPAHWMLEAKYVPADFEANGLAYGLTSGILFDFDGNVEEIYAYVPYSRMILNYTSVLHLNLGWEAIKETDWEHGFMKGARVDLGISDRFALLAEIAAVNFDDYFYQGGIRLSLIHRLLEMDITYGEGFRRMETAPGFNIGIAFTPDQVW